MTVVFQDKSMKGIICLLLCCCIHRGCCFNLTLLHTNDVHAKFEEFNQYLAVCSEDESNEGKCFGGMARHVTISRDLRNSANNVLYLNAGDFFQGTLWYTYYQGAATAHFANKLGIDAATLGNHEFDDGVEVLSAYLQNTSFPFVACNLDSSREPALNDLYQPAILITVGGEDIGVVGYITQETTKLVSPDYLENLIFEDEVESIRREVEGFLSAGVNKIIVVGHGGFLLDQKIAREVEGIDVIVGGHSNTFLYTGEAPSNNEPIGPYPVVVQQDNGAKVLVVQDYAYGKYMGHLQLTFDEQGVVTSYGGNPILLDSSIKQDPETLEEIEQWRQPLERLLTEPVGETFVFLNGTREECRARECNMGNLLTDAVLHSYLVSSEMPGDWWTDIAIAVWNGGAIRSNIEQGSITVGAIIETFPFRNEVAGITIPGYVILEMLEQSVKVYEPSDLKGGFLQMSGLKVEYNLWNPAGERVVRVQVRCAKCRIPRYEELDMDEMYGILTSTFMLSGGDGYTMLSDHGENLLPSGKVSADVVIDYVKQYSPVITGLEGRISFSHSQPIPPKPSCGSRKIPGVIYTVFTLATILILLFGR